MIFYPKLVAFIFWPQCKAKYFFVNVFDHNAKQKSTYISISHAYLLRNTFDLIFFSVKKLLKVQWSIFLHRNIASRIFEVFYNAFFFYLFNEKMPFLQPPIQPIWVSSRKILMLVLESYTPTKTHSLSYTHIFLISVWVRVLLETSDIFCKSFLRRRVSN